MSQSSCNQNEKEQLECPLREEILAIKELLKKIIRCETCQFKQVGFYKEPCFHCDNYSKWKLEEKE